MGAICRWKGLCLGLLLVTSPAAAQGPAPVPAPPARLRVFLDCQYECDADYLRQNIEFIEYVRDRATSDVHVLVTTEGTGGGGMSWVVEFLGQDFFMGRDQKLNFTTAQTSTPDDRRREFARVFRIGLVGYAAVTSVAQDLDVSFRRQESGTRPSAGSTRDPWNYWVFRIGMNGNMNGEQSSNNRSYRLNFSGNRTTEQWKINVNVNSNSNNSTFRVSDELTIKSSTNGWNVNTLVVKSLGPNWSYGARTNVSHSSFSNTDRSVGGFPAIEFDFFPYSESSRRRLTVQYAVGVTKYQYRDITIYDKLQETVPSHSLNTSVGFRAPWGSVGAGATLSQHLNHTDRWRFSLNGDTDIRLFKGLSFNIFGNYDKIRDQIGLRKGDVSTEELLLRIQQQATGYSYYMGGGISYSFGSIFNSIVNPRF